MKGFIKVNTLSEWQKEYLNKNLDWSTSDRIGSNGKCELGLDTAEYNTIFKENSGTFCMGYYHTTFVESMKQFQFNDIVKEVM